MTSDTRGDAHRTRCIGREQTPAERSLANARERPEAQDYHGSALYWSRTGGEWEDLTADEKQVWIDAALDMLTEHARTYESPTDPPDDGGQRRTA